MIEQLQVGQEAEIDTVKKEVERLDDCSLAYYDPEEYREELETIERAERVLHTTF